MGDVTDDVLTNSYRYDDINEIEARLAKKEKDLTKGPEIDTDGYGKPYLDIVGHATKKSKYLVAKYFRLHPVEGKKDRYRIAIVVKSSKIGTHMAFTSNKDEYDYVSASFQCFLLSSLMANILEIENHE